MRVLIVEDDILLSLDVAEIVTDAGFKVVGPASSVVEALELIKVVGCDIAILDVNLGKETSAPVAAELRTRVLPFVVLSAYSADKFPSEFKGLLNLLKPVNRADLISALRSCAVRA